MVAGCQFPITQNRKGLHNSGNRKPVTGNLKTMQHYIINKTLDFGRLDAFGK